MSIFWAVSLFCACLSLPAISASPGRKDSNASAQRHTPAPHAVARTARNAQRKDARRTRPARWAAADRGVPTNARAGSPWRARIRRRRLPPIWRMAARKKKHLPCGGCLKPSRGTGREDRTTANRNGASLVTSACYPINAAFCLSTTAPLKSGTAQAATYLCCPVSRAERRAPGWYVYHDAARASAEGNAFKPRERQADWINTMHLAPVYRRWLSAIVITINRRRRALAGIARRRRLSCCLYTIPLHARASLTALAPHRLFTPQNTHSAPYRHLNSEYPQSSFSRGMR